MASKYSHTTRNLGLRSDRRRGGVCVGVENQSQSGGEGWPGRRLNSATHSGLSAIRVKGLPTHLQHYRNLTTLISCLIINKLPYRTSSLTHMWLVIRQRMTKCVFCVLCLFVFFSSLQFFSTGLCFMSFCVFFCQIYQGCSLDLL